MICTWIWILCNILLQHCFKGVLSVSLPKVKLIVKLPIILYLCLYIPCKFNLSVEADLLTLWAVGHASYVRVHTFRLSNDYSLPICWEILHAWSAWKCHSLLGLFVRRNHVFCLENSSPIFPHCKRHLQKIFHLTKPLVCLPLQGSIFIFFQSYCSLMQSILLAFFCAMSTSMLIWTLNLVLESCGLVKGQLVTHPFW